MARQEKEWVADFWSGDAFFYGERQVFFAGCEWSEFGMSYDYTGGDTGVGRDGFVSGVASDNVCAGLTDDAC